MRKDDQLKTSRARRYVKIRDIFILRHRRTQDFFREREGEGSYQFCYTAIFGVNALLFSDVLVRA